MSEEELAHVAEEAYQLTDIAKEVLQYEITNRKLDVRLQLEPPKEEEPESPSVAEEEDRCVDEDDCDEDGDGEFDANSLDLMVVRRVWDMEEARTVHRILTDACVPCYLGDDNIEDPSFYEGSFEGGIDMKICEADGNRAIPALAMNWPEPSLKEEAAEEETPEEETAESAEEPEYAICCPKCQSNEVVFEGRDGVMTGNEAFNAKFEWHCDACGHRWEDDGVEQSMSAPIE